MKRIDFKITLYYILLFSVSTLIGGNVFAQDDVTGTVTYYQNNTTKLIYTDNGGYVYYFIKGNNNNLTLTNKVFKDQTGKEASMTCSYSSDLIIPSTITVEENGQINTYTVTAVGKRAAWASIDTSTAPANYVPLKSVTIPPTVTSIGYAAFSDNHEITTINGLNNVTTIDKLAFCKTNITSVILSDKLTEIGEEVFWHCGSLTDVAIPASVLKINNWAFRNTPNLRRIVMEGSNPPAFVGSPFTEIISQERDDLTVYVPCGGLDAYKNHTDWKKLSIKISNDMPSVLTGKWHYNSTDCAHCRIPSTVTLKEGGSLSADDYTNLVHAFEDAHTTLKIEKTLNVDTWNFLGDIENGSKIDDWLFNSQPSGYGNEIEVYPFNENHTDWASALATTDETVLGHGYLLYVEPNTWNESGLSYQTSGKTTTITRTAYDGLTNTNNINDDIIRINYTTANNSGEYFLALSNPFICDMNIKEFTNDDDNSTNIQGPAIYYNNGNQWAMIDGDLSEYDIPPMVGFMIGVAPAVGSSNIISLNRPREKSTGHPIPKSTEAKKIATLVATSKGISQKLFAELNAEASDGFDIKDAYAVVNDGFEWHFVVDNKKLWKNAFASDNYICPVSFVKTNNGVVNISIDTCVNDIEVSLIDNLTEEETVLSEEPISLTLDAGTTDNRYQIHFVKKNVGINELANKESNISIWNSRNVINVNGNELKRIEVYNTLGQMVYSSQLAGNNASINTNLKDGAYIVKVQDNKTNKTQKLVIR